MNVKLLVSIVAALLAGFAGGIFYGLPIEDAGDTPQSFSEQLPIKDARETNNLDQYQNTIAVEPCYFFQCLFKASGQIIGYAELDGYYQAETVTGGGEEGAYVGQTLTCDRFVITGGSQPLINQFRGMIESGNTLHRIMDDKLIINLNLDDQNLDPTLIERIRASTAQSPISLGALQTYRDGKGAGPCTSILRVVNENKVMTMNLTTSLESPM